MKRVMKAVVLCVLASVMLTGCSGTKSEIGGKGTSPQTSAATGTTGRL